MVVGSYLRSLGRRLVEVRQQLFHVRFGEDVERLAERRVSKVLSHASDSSPDFPSLFLGSTKRK